jgi:hypothetical protein
MPREEPPRRRDTPNPNRPRLPEEDESKLLPLDRLTAQAYTALEDGIDAIKELFGDGVPIAVNVTDTGVIKLDKAAQEKIRQG